MRLVVQYSAGDGCTYSCEYSIPFEYESAERLLLDIEERVTKFLKAPYDKREAHYDFKLSCGDSDIFLEHFIERDVFYPPSIYTVDEWFAANGVK